ncbi:MAG: 23S rRNA (adenine(2503)-C(2))-methyltransferase RlmN [Planctomycetes bacterium]|nr:23S rRNA (adenine(2503)-C(2))-methyltransferase RlmN [Planctomycetota bacterium]
MKHLLEMRAEQLTAELESLDEAVYRAAQILEWVYHKGVCDVTQMTNLPADLCGRLAGQLSILTGRVIARCDALDGVIKLLIEWPDGERVETVLIPDRDRATACVSTQVGCAMQCTFCASGMDGLTRNLTCGEIVEQVLHLQLEGQRHVTNVVFMGMGEPLANYDETVAAVRAMIDPKRLGISARRVTVSTVGLPKQIRRLAAEDLPITLAISLHGATDALRQRLVPKAARSPLKDILAAARVFYGSRKREVTLEYVLLAGLNDTPQCAETLAEVAHSLRCNVNLIPYNPVTSLPDHKPDATAVADFAAWLRHRQVNVNIRRPRGLEADAACGQLRKRNAQHHWRRLLL